MADLGSEANEAHRRDYAAKAKYDACRRSIADIAADEDAWRRLGSDGQKDLRKAMDRLNRLSAHIVAVWD